MSVVTICDASGKKLLPCDIRSVPWGWQRVYAPEAFKAVEAYLKALHEAAVVARELFEDRREAARAEFHLLYPDGLLPDEAEDAAEAEGEDA